MRMLGTRKGEEEGGAHGAGEKDQGTPHPWSCDLGPPQDPALGHVRETRHSKAGFCSWEAGVQYEQGSYPRKGASAERLHPGVRGGEDGS